MPSCNDMVIHPAGLGPPGASQGVLEHTMGLLGTASLSRGL